MLGSMSTRDDEPGITPFSTAFTLAGFALADAAGLKPIATVMGADIRWVSQPLPLPRRVGGTSSRWLERAVVAVPELDDQINTAREHAVSRLTAEAAELAADAVIDIHQIPGVIDWREVGDKVRLVARLGAPTAAPRVSRPLEYQLIGTAVRDAANRSETPRLSTVSPADFWKLRQGGWLPVGVVGGCSYRFARALWAGYNAGELPEASRAWAEARAAALDQVRAATVGLAADGVVGIDVQTDHQTIEWRQPATDLEAKGLLVGVNMIATAIARARRAAPGFRPPTRILTLG